MTSLFDWTFGGKPVSYFVCIPLPSLKLRMEYLSLMLSIVRSTDYLEHRHRLPDLRSALRRILGEEDEAGDDLDGSATAKQMDKLIVQEMYREFPQLGESKN